MRQFLTLLLLAGVIAPVLAQDPKQPPQAKDAKDLKEQKEPKVEKPEPTLKVGSLAPELKAEKWLQGSEVKAFEPGKVYVVEFWATWCGPCISAMPHLAQLQEQFKDKGVTFIGFSASDPNNTTQQVSDFVTKRGPKLKYTFAFSDNKEIYDAWMKAAGRNGIPCSFVVGKDSKLAYIGHPIYLDSVIPKVVDGSWNPTEGMAEVAKVTKELMALNKVAGGKDAEVSLKAIEEFESKNPGMAHAGYFTGQRVDALVKLKKIDEAKTVSQGAIEKAIKWGDVLRLRALSSALRSADNKDLVALSLKAAEAMVAVAGDKDVSAVLNLAQTYQATGDKAKAAEFADKALSAASTGSPALKRHVEQEVQKIKETEK